MQCEASRAPSSKDRQKPPHPFGAGLPCKMPEEGRTEVPSRSSRLTWCSCELPRTVNSAGPGRDELTELGCANSPCPAGPREKHHNCKASSRNCFSSSQIQELFQHLPNVTPPTKHSCVHIKEGAPAGLTFLFAFSFLLSSHLSLQYYSWPGTMEPP